MQYVVRKIYKLLDIVILRRVLSTTEIIKARYSKLAMDKIVVLKLDYANGF